jgi:hypothetical protein
MRVTSDLFVSALVRRIHSGGGFAAVERRGSSEAGAIFLVLRDRDGSLTLYGPAPQSAYEEGRPNERRFQVVLETADEGQVADKLAREGRFDPDLWIVECECRRDELEEIAGVRTP